MWQKLGTTVVNQFSVLVQGPLEGEGLKTFCYGLCIFTATSIVPVEPHNSVRDDKVIDLFSCLHQQEIKVELTQESCEPVRGSS